MQKSTSDNDEDGATDVLAPTSTIDYLI